MTTEASPPAPVHERLWRHMKSLWPRWTIFPPLPFLVYGAYMIVIGDLRWDHVAMMIAMPLFAYGNARTKKLFTGAGPIAYTALFYDAMRYFRNVGVSPERVHDCDLRGYELALFGINSNGEKITVHDWFLNHHWDALDIYCGIPYGTYIFAALGCAIVLWGRDYRAVQRFSWGFLVMNIVAFATYHIYPAAPPWYYHAHGCVIDMTANPEAGPRLTHVDQMLGITFFHGLYARSSDIYGAVPSLHVAYPLLILVEGWRLFKVPGKIFSIVFFISMGFAAVYLDHHWIIDVVLGIGYCLGSAALVRFIWRKITAGDQPKPAAPAEPVASPAASA